MTREELKAHCEKQIELCETWVYGKGEKPSGKIYEEHKLILELLEQESCDDAISRQWLMECVNEGWIKFDTEEDKNRFTHLVRDMAPPVTPQPKIGHWIEEETYMECPNCHDIWHYEKNQTERFKCCPTCGERIK